MRVLLKQVRTSLWQQVGRVRGEKEGLGCRGPATIVHSGCVLIVIQNGDICHQDCKTKSHRRWVQELIDDVNSKRAENELTPLAV